MKMSGKGMAGGFAFSPPLSLNVLRLQAAFLQQT